MNAPGVVVGIDIAAPAEMVWDVISDITVMPRFSTELQSVGWAPGFDGPRMGALFHGANRHPSVGEWTTRSEIVDFDPPRRFGWAVGGAENPVATWIFDLSPIAEGTRLAYTARVGPGRSGLTMLIEREPQRTEEIVERRMAQWRSGMQATLAGIRELAEASAGQLPRNR
ncbi:MAG: SRPBCC family protein [Mycobacterium sp.]